MHNAVVNVSVSCKLKATDSTFSLIISIYIKLSIVDGTFERLFYCTSD